MDHRPCVLHAVYVHASMCMGLYSTLIYAHLTSAVGQVVRILYLACGSGLIHVLPDNKDLFIKNIVTKIKETSHKTEARKKRGWHTVESMKIKLRWSKTGAQIPLVCMTTQYARNFYCCMHIYPNEHQLRKVLHCWGGQVLREAGEQAPGQATR